MKIQLPVWKVTLLIALFLTVLGNFSFWGNVFSKVDIAEEPFLYITLFLILISTTHIFLTLISFKPIFKVVASLILITSAFAAYFMDNYAIMIDKGMIRNVMVTDVTEATELFSFKLLITVLALGVVPSFLLFKTKINYKPWFTGLLHKVLVLSLTIGVLVGTVYSNYQQISFFGRDNREVRHLINPTNYILSLKSIVSNAVSAGVTVVKPIGTDAKTKQSTLANGKPMLAVLVLGETARAMNFSLNGYSRDTNPLMAKEMQKGNIINFSNVDSCGTATAVSVPCMFSKFTRSDFNHDKGKEYENLLDVAKYAGFDVLWLDNNTGCQGTCLRVNYTSLANSKDPVFCKGGNCFDEILLSELKNKIDNISNNTLIVLHQNGNHGPTYSKRYPKEFEMFKPVCETNQLIKCSNEEIVNAYDNAILYTDHFLAETIKILNSFKDKYIASMVYISDHGESLGENNLYLHGLPYSIAPDHQKKVPMMLWMSKNYEVAQNIDRKCLSQKSSNSLSHDNFFSSMLGLMSIDTQVYDQKLDFLSDCKNNRLVNINSENVSKQKTESKIQIRL